MTVAVQTITPLIIIQNDAFAKAYEQGLWWCLFGEREGDGPLPDSYLVEDLRNCGVRDLFNGQHENALQHIGFYIGMIHGGILSSQTLQLCPNVTALVTFHDREIARGYSAGRDWFFNEAEPEQRRYTDRSFIERLRESITDMLSFGDGDETWNYSIGCVLGELSGRLFPQTPQESTHWEETRRKFAAHVKRCQESKEQHTEPLSIPTVAI